QVGQVLPARFVLDSEGESVVSLGLVVREKSESASLSKPLSLVVLELIRFCKSPALALPALGVGVSSLGVGGSDCVASAICISSLEIFSCIMRSASSFC